MIEQLLSADNFILDATPLLLASLLIKSSIVVGIAGAIAFLLRYSSASLRHIVLTIAMASLLVVPLLVLVLPAWELPLLPSNDTPEIDNAEAFAPKIADGELTTFVWSGDGQFSVSVTTPAPQAVADMIETQTPIQVESSPVQSAPSLAGMAEGRPWNWKAVLAMVWLSGVTIVLSRLFLAHAGVGLLLRRSRIVENEDWRFAVDRYARLLGIDRPVRIRTSALANVPMIIGCRRPILVLPEEFESWSEERRRIVLLHELAHVKRHDCFSQNIVEIVCAAYWFNPMVWLASRQIRVEREIACDDMVLMAGTKPSTYAQTILDTIKNIRQEEWSPVASIAMARKSDIEGRLISILDPDVRRAKLNRASAILTIGLIAAVAVPIALAVPVRKQAEPLAPEQPVADSADMPALAGESSWAPVVKNQAVESVEEPFSFEFDFDANDLFADDSPSSSWSTTTDVASAPEVDCCGTGTTLAVGRNSERAPTWTTSDTLTVKQLIKLRQYGVDLEFIDDLNALGYNDLNVDELIELAKYGADPEYISELNAAGYLQLQVDEIVRFSKYGVDGELIAALRAAGYKSITADEIVELSKYGLDEDDIAEFAQVGYANLPVDDLVSLSKYGVDPDDIAEFRSAGYGNLSTNDFIELSKYGVDPDDVAELRSAGLTNLSVGELVDISKYGVDADDIKDLASAGYVNLSVDDLVQIGKYGVDVDDLADLSKLGYSDMDVGELVELSKYGVDIDEISELAEMGYDDLTVDELVEISKYGTDVDDLAELRDMGYTNMSVNDMIMIGRYGVDVDDVRTLKNAGYVFTVDEMIQLSRYGVDGDEIAQLARVGYKDLSIDELVDMAKYGVDADDITKLSDRGIKNLSVSQIIDLTKYDVDPDIVAELEKLGHRNVKPDYLIKMAKYGIDADYLSDLHDAGVEASLDEIIELGKHNVDPDFIRKMKKGNN